MQQGQQQKLQQQQQHRKLFQLVQQQQHQRLQQQFKKSESHSTSTSSLSSTVASIRIQSASHQPPSFSLIISLPLAPSSSAPGLPHHQPSSFSSPRHQHRSVSYIRSIHRIFLIDPIDATLRPRSTRLTCQMLLIQFALPRSSTSFSQPSPIPPPSLLVHLRLPSLLQISHLLLIHRGRYWVPVESYASIRSAQTTDRLEV